MKNYGKLIKEERKKRNWTQQIVAEKINVTKEAISNYETGKRQISFTNLEKLLNIFGYSSNYLLEENSEEPMQFSFRATDKFCEEEEYLMEWVQNFVLDHFEAIKLKERKYK